MNSADFFPWIVGLFIVVLFALLIWAGIEDEKQWKVYSQANHCKESGYISGSVGVGYAYTGGKNGGGPVTTYTPSKTRYLCDNNVEIYR